MRKDKELTLDEHLENANDLAIATHHLRKIIERTQKHYPLSSPLIKALYKISPGDLGGIFCKVQSLLDDEYHKSISNEVFDEHRHVYYNLEERYKKIKNVI